MKQTMDASGAAHVEDAIETADDEGAATAAAAAVATHQRLQQLAAARTLEAAVSMVHSRRARQRRTMRPYLLEEGARVRVSFLYAPTVRRTLKRLHSVDYLPKWTVELYTVVKRQLAPGSRRVVLYHLQAKNGVGIGAPCTVGSQTVHLRLDLLDVDRRWLQPVPLTRTIDSDGSSTEQPAVTRTIASRFPRQTLALSAATRST